MTNKSLAVINRSTLEKSCVIYFSFHGLELKLARASLCSESLRLLCKELKRDMTRDYRIKTFEAAITYFYSSTLLTKFMMSTETDGHTCCMNPSRLNFSLS